jgi:hypothetical protein
VGIWGVNVPVAWGFAIVNFVRWSGIGHAGTLISAILLLLPQPWRTSIYRRFWFRHVEPNRSRLDARQETQVWDELAGALPGLVAGVWEQLVREAVLRGEWLGRTWRAVGPWWGAGLDRRPHEIDVVAESSDGRTLLLGEVEWTARPDLPRLAAELREKARTFPLAGARELCLAVWVRQPPARPVDPDLAVFGPADVLAVLR